MINNKHYNLFNIKNVLIVLLTVIIIAGAALFAACNNRASLTSIAAEYIGEDIEVGDALNKDDIIVWAKYSNTAKKIVSAFEIVGFDSETAGDKIVTVKFTDNNVTKITTVNIKVVEKVQPVTLTSITAVYNGKNIIVGGSLNKTEIKVTAYFSNDTNKTVTDFQLGEFDSATTGDKDVKISYSVNGITKTTTVTVTVIDGVAVTATLEKIEAVYSGKEIMLNGNLTKSDITVTAYYSDNSDKVVTDFDINGFDSSTVGIKQIIVSYTENDVTVGCEVEISVVNNNKEEVADYGKYGILQQDGSVKITNTAYVQDELQIHFLAVTNNSPGDSVYIKAGDVDILIDAGSTTAASTSIPKYLQDNNLVLDNKFEFVIATHSDSDHISGLAGSGDKNGILDKYQFDTIITYPAYYGNKGGYMGEKTAVQTRFETKCQALADNGVNVFTDVDCYNNAKEGAQRIYKLTDNIEMEILNNAYYKTKGSNNNNYSVCVMFNQYGDGYDFDNPTNPNNRNYVNHFLFTGDLEGTGEELLVQNNNLPEVVLFKGGHHGSKTSSNTVLMNKIMPKVVCVCTCCGETVYGFPAQEFIDRVAQYTDMVFMTNQRVEGSLSTPLNGNIVVKSNLNGVFVNCSNNNKLFKDTDWFKNNRVCPQAWKKQEETSEQQSA